MASTTKDKRLIRVRRARRARARLHGTAAHPRLSVNRSLRHISAQLINDDLGVTVCAAGDRTLAGTKNKKERAAAVGAEIAKRAQEAGVTTVVFDRGSARYHGRVQALAEAAREAGLIF